MMTFKQLLKAAAVQFTIGLAAIFYAWIFKPGFFGFLLFSYIVLAAFQLYQLYKNRWNTYGLRRKLLKSFVSTTAFIIVLYLLGRYLGGYGMLGFLAIIFVVAGWKIKQQWGLYTETINTANDIIHGVKKDAGPIEKKP